MSTDGLVKDGKDSKDGRKNVVIVGGGAAGMVRTASLHVLQLRLLTRSSHAPILWLNIQTSSR